MIKVGSSAHMEQNDIEIELELLNRLQSEYSQYIKKRDWKSGTPTTYNYKIMRDIINDCFIEDTQYLEHRIEDMIFFLNELKKLEVIKDGEFVDYDRRVRLKYLYESEYQSLKHSLKIFDDETKNKIIEALEDHLEEYNTAIFTQKGFILIRDIISHFRDYHRDVQFSNAIKEISPDDLNLRSLLRALETIASYAKGTKQEALKILLESNKEDIKNMINAKKISKANKKIVDVFYDSVLGLLANFTTIKGKYQKPTSKKIYNELADELTKSLKQIEMNFIG